MEDVMNNLVTYYFHIIYNNYRNLYFIVVQKMILYKMEPISNYLKFKVNLKVIVN